MPWLIMNTPFLIASMFAGRLAVWIGTATCWLGVLLPGLRPRAGVFDTRRRFTGGVARLRADRGAGYGMAVPTISAVAVSALPLEHSGLASGVLNSARQVGTAVDAGDPGSIGLAVTRSSWAACSAELPTSAQAGAPDVSRMRAVDKAASPHNSWAPLPNRSLTVPSSTACTWRC